jgi:hypothetical protein
MIYVRERLTTRPGKLINENRTDFIRLGRQLFASTSFFIIAFRFNGNVMIHHQAALAPKSAEGTFPPSSSPIATVGKILLYCLGLKA